jgi:hypothetical protein
MENTMATLDNLKFTNTVKPKHQAPIVGRRNKLSKKLWEQIKLAEALASGNELVVNHWKTVRDAEGNRKSIEVPKRIKPWWFNSEQGKICLAVKYGSRVLELKKGLPTIEVANTQELVNTLEVVKQAVDQGELDREIEAASGALRANFGKSK